MYSNPAVLCLLLRAQSPSYLPTQSGMPQHQTPQCLPASQMTAVRLQTLPRCLYAAARGMGPYPVSGQLLAGSWQE